MRRDSATRSAEPRTKPTVKIRDLDKTKEKTKKPEEPKPSSKELADDFDKILEDFEMSGTDQTPQLGDMEHVERMIDEFGSDIEPDELPKPDPGRPPGGESKTLRSQMGRVVPIPNSSKA